MKNNILLLAEQFNENKTTGVWEAFAGSAGWTLKAILHQAGIRMDECAIDCVFPFRVKPTMNIVHNMTGKRAEGIVNFPPLKPGKYIRAKYAHYLTELEQRVRKLNPNVILAVGEVASWATMGEGKINSCRGVTNESLFGCKVIPTYKMLSVMRDWSLRPIVLADVTKLKRQSMFPELIKPTREIWINPTLDDMEMFFENFILPADELSIDIETANDQITCIGFAPTVNRALVIPFYSRTAPRNNFWHRLEDELKAWKFVKQVCEETHRLDAPVTKTYKRKIVGQNFLYDIRFLWEKYGITVPGMTNDTMLLSHAQQPEMKKALGFLASVHTDESSWKFMRTKSTRKKED